LNRHVDRIADRSDDFAIERRTCTCRIEIHHVNPTSTCVGKHLGLRNWIVVVNGFACVVTLIQTYGMTVEQINGGIQLHQLPTFRRAASTKPRRSSSPTVPDFSGWNCVCCNSTIFNCCQKLFVVRAPRLHLTNCFLCSIRVHEVERLVFNSVKERGICRNIYGIPTHVRQYWRIQFCNALLPNANSLVKYSVGMFISIAKEDLHSNANAKRRAFLFYSFANDRITTNRN